MRSSVAFDLPWPATNLHPVASESQHTHPRTAVPGRSRYEAVASCLALPEVRARTGRRCRDALGGSLIPREA